MILNGYCDKIKEDVKINVEIINANALEDINNKNNVVGRISCNYASSVNCNGKNCSILKQNGYKN